MSAAAVMFAVSLCSAEPVNYGAMTDLTIHTEDIVLVTKWDKVFPKNDEVNHKKVTFVNHFGITLAADMYEPKKYDGKLPALAVCGSYSAVKEQVFGSLCSGDGEAWFLDDSVRSVILRRKQQLSEIHQRA